MGTVVYMAPRSGCMTGAVGWRSRTTLTYTSPLTKATLFLLVHWMAGDLGKSKRWALPVCTQNVGVWLERVKTGCWGFG